MAGLVFIILLSLAAVFGPLVYRHNYFDQNLQYANMPPAFPTYSVPQKAAWEKRVSSSIPAASCFTPSDPMARLAILSDRQKRT